MERYAWRATVLPGKLAEYKRRHDDIWPEMRAVLAAAGIRNYTIWNVGDTLFGYYECDSVEYASPPAQGGRVLSTGGKRSREKMGFLYERRHGNGAGPGDGRAAKTCAGVSF